MSSTPTTPAGWYPNPERAGQLRYWDGEAWTDHVHDEAPAAPAPEPQPPAAPPEPPPFAAPGQPTGRETIAVPPGGGFGADAPPQFGAPPSAQPQFGAPPQFGSPPPPGFGQPAYATAGAGAPETPGFIGAYTDVFKNYTNFSGRLSVGGYWRFIAIHFAIGVVLQVLMAAESFFLIFGGLYSLALLLPSLAAVIRRLHDTGKSGWWVLIAFTLIGIIVLIVWLVQSGEQQPNKYGPPPVQASA
ncbi:MAG: DUF805 domain-containing protein [Acidimicrobiales bacterium]